MKEPILYAGQLMDRGAQSNIKTNSSPETFRIVTIYFHVKERLTSIIRAF